MKPFYYLPEIIFGALAISTLTLLKLRIPKRQLKKRVDYIFNTTPMVVKMEQRRRRRRQPPVKKIIYIDIHNTVMDFGSGFRKIPRSELLSLKEAASGNYKKIIKLYALADPIGGTKEALAKLSEYYEIYLVSTPIDLEAVTEIVKWVTKELGYKWKSKLIIIHNTDLLKGDYYISEKPSNKHKFEGVQIRFGYQEFPIWNSVINHLNPTEKVLI